MSQRTFDLSRMRFPAWATVCCAAVLLISVLCAPVAGTQYIVAPSGGSFTNIQNAVTWASPLDTIIVQSGTYPGTVKIEKRISLIGVNTGGGAPIIDPGRMGTSIEIDADNCTVQGFVIQNSAEASGILVTSNGNVISNNTITGNAVGIQVSSADSNTVAGNSVTSNSRAGIALKNAQDNLIFGNRVTNNAIGISTDELSSSNTIFFNTFTNTENVLSRGSGQQWDSPTALSYVYMGRSFTGPLGNYWSDYRGGSDQASDGVGDTPYVVRADVIRTAGTSTSNNAVDPAPLLDPIDYYLQVRPAASVTGTTASPVSSAITAPAGQEPQPAVTLP